MLIDLPTAQAHLCVDGSDDSDLITLYLGAAERSIAEYVCRNIYADKASLYAAISAAPDALVSAKSTYDSAILSADAIADDDLREMAYLAANEAYSNAMQSTRMTYQGIVLNDQLKAAILLVLGHLYANREDSVVGVSVVDLPMGSRYLADPFRAY